MSNELKIEVILGNDLLQAIEDDIKKHPHLENSVMCPMVFVAIREYKFIEGKCFVTIERGYIPFYL